MTDKQDKKEEVRSIPEQLDYLLQKVNLMEANQYRDAATVSLLRAEVQTKQNSFSDSINKVNAIFKMMEEHDALQRKNGFEIERLDEYTKSGFESIRED